jgi:hypothetical protein
MIIIEPDVAVLRVAELTNKQYDWSVQNFGQDNIRRIAVTHLASISEGSNKVKS